MTISVQLHFARFGVNRRHSHPSLAGELVCRVGIIWRFSFARRAFILHF